jgi:hypothetical protein
MGLFDLTGRDSGRKGSRRIVRIVSSACPVSGVERRTGRRLIVCIVSSVSADVLFMLC